MEGRIVRCPSCGRANRIPAKAAGKKVVCGQCRTPIEFDEERTGPLAVTDATFESAIAGAVPVVVDFWAGWCAPCRQIAPVIERLASSRSDVRFAKLDVDANPATARRFNVTGIPTLVFFREGREAGRITGAVGQSAIESAIGRYFG